MASPMLERRRNGREVVPAPHIVLLGGTTREGSSCERLVQRCAALVEDRGGVATTFVARDLDLPMYAPQDPARVPRAVALVEDLRRCDGVVVASPGYHGGISGLVKNALDYVEDLRDDDRPYLDGRAVGCVVSAAGWQGASTTLSALRDVVHALRGWPTPLGVTLNSTEPFDPASGSLDGQLTVMVDQVLGMAADAIARRPAPVDRPTVVRCHA